EVIWLVELIYINLTIRIRVSQKRWFWLSNSKNYIVKPQKGETFVSPFLYNFSISCQTLQPPQIQYIV
ncbi:MAG: hypothetical protein JXR48_08130, partial [Candidatus Delongbacteria bacterium]|nr:hypothetical protein [Candidatus Delongbacteria bacterium]MBN2834921.1 hypothetical protein [Candidatus Delongbacteria bacterium]